MAGATAAVPTHRTSALQRRLRGFLILCTGVVTIATIFLGGGLALLCVGWMLVACGILELLETFQAADETSRQSTYFSGVVSIVAGCLLMAQPQFVVRGLALFVAGSFLIDGLSKILAARRLRAVPSPWKWKLAAGVINVVISLILITGWPVSGLAVVFVVVAIRMFAIGWPLLLRPGVSTSSGLEKPSESLHPDRRLGLPAHAEFAKLEAAYAAQDEKWLAANAYWGLMFIAVFFAIHFGRMHVDFNVVGFISPLVAVFGDIVTAMIVAFVILLPVRLGWRRLTRPIERRAWTHWLARADQGKGPGLFGRVSGIWLRRRLKFSRRVAQAARSPQAALRWGMHIGLPVTAILIAVNPIWGFSWFFNSESWATEVWNRWAEARTDTWREEMIRAVREQYAGVGMASDQLFRVEPEGVADGDFSFLVLGDTGEGDASQFCLKDQFLALGQRPDVKFLVISSDVIYPTGAMSDYEAKFYLPFKGFTKPIYAIPGNHDWYDALEGFAANFFEPNAARTAIHTRIVTDKRLTTTTDRRIDAMVRDADRLRREFGISNGHQRGPFFEIQTDRFSLIAVDTGGLRGIDSEEWSWLEGALERSKGFKMVILGHPLYAGGRYQGGDDLTSGEWVGETHSPAIPGLKTSDVHQFATIHDLLRKHGISVVMAGDTHYFEHYRETYSSEGASRTMEHFVNGGGGAYISIGTPLDWPRKPAVPDCGYYPRKDALIAKLDRETPRWKSPLWFWTKRLGGWPFSAEAFAGAFDFNGAPYFQSFVEVRVEHSQNRVRMIVHSANGPLHWRDLECLGTDRPAEKSDDDIVKYVIPMADGRIKTQETRTK
ncbi:MAG: DUF308 domain-containing protein [Gemmataceae bacterium]